MSTSGREERHVYIWTRGATCLHLDERGDMSTSGREERHVYIWTVVSVTKNHTKRVGLVQSGHHHLIKLQLVLAMI
jgi:hypothetical protein